MTALFSTRRRAEEFAAALDGRSSILTGELRELVDVTTVLRSHDSLQAARPRDDFASDLRARLMAEAVHVLVPGDAPLVLPARQRGPRERRLVAAASVVVLLGGTAGIAAAAQQSLPGEALYPIKRGLERAEAGLSISTAGKGQDLLRQASDRLVEVESLLAGGSLTAAPRVPQTLDDFTAQAQEGSGLLMASFEETRDPASIVEIREFTADGITMLQDLARTAPAEAQDELAAAAVDRAFAVVDGRFLDNSHPFIVDKRSVTRDTDALTASAGDTDGTGSVTAPTGDENTSPSLDLPGSDADTSKSNDDAKKAVEETVDNTVGQITNGLTGVVETVLPDPLDTLGD